MSAHTPGPWQRHGSTVRAVGSSNRKLADVKILDDEGLANARLVTTAPQLLMALEDAIDILQPLAEQLPSVRSRCEGYARIVRLAREG